MENYAQGPIHELLYWGGLHESQLFNPNATEALKNKERIKQLERHHGRHVKRRLFPGCMSGQTMKIRLTPLPNIEKVDVKNRNDKVQTTQVSDVNVWEGAKREHAMISSLLRHAAMGYLCFYRKPKLSPQTSPLPCRRSDTSFWTASESSTPLPVFQRRNPTEQFLIRRPTIEKTEPLTNDDELFEELAQMDLKPIPFKKTADSYKFYERNFPLLLTKITADIERCSTPSKRSRTPESPMSAMIARKRILNQRLVDLESMMVDMEKATEDVAFKTELHDPVFDPTTWPWNKMDVQSLRRRYTIDASLREM